MSASSATAPMVPQRQRLARQSRQGVQRRRVIAAMGSLVVEHGRRGATIDRIVAQAGVSKTTFYELFVDPDDCFVAAVKTSFDKLFAGIAAAKAPAEAPWDERAATMIAALIATFDRDRELAPLCLLHAHAGGGTALAVRNAAVARLANALVDGLDRDDIDPRLVATMSRGAVGAILQLVQTRLVNDPAGSVADLTGPAISHGVAQFSDPDTAARWANDPPSIPGREPDGAAAEGDARDQMLFTELARVTLLHLESNPGARNVDVAHAIGVRHESQISRHLVRLEQAGVVTRSRIRGANEWRLTDRGHEAARTLRRHGPA